MCLSTQSPTRSKGTLPSSSSPSKRALPPHIRAHHSPVMSHTIDGPPPSIQQQSETALQALLSCDKTLHTSRSSTPTSSHTNDSFTTSSTFDFPDGGRFRVSLSGPPFTAFVDGHQGLPDGFLMEINNFIFSTLFNSVTPTPQTAIQKILQQSDALYTRVMEVGRRRVDVSNQPDVEPEIQSSRLATAALMKQLSMLEAQDTRRDGFIARPSNENLYIWTLQLFFEPSVQQKLTALGYDALQLELRFPVDYPYAPPFVRVVAPYVKCRYVLPRGGICMQLFTTSGWTPANSIDAVCVQIRAMLLAGSLDIAKNHAYKYTYDGALKDLQSAVRQHRWDQATADSKTPKKLKLKY